MNLSSLSKNRRGVSPLIATVLLIAFAVALGTVIMNWGRSELQGQESVLPSLCYEGESTLGRNLKFSIENMGNSEIQVMDLIITTSNGTEQVLTGLDSSSIPPGESSEPTKFEYDPSVSGKIAKMTLTFGIIGEVGQCK